MARSPGDPHRYLLRLPGGDPAGLAAWIKRHLEALAMQGFAERGLYSRSRDLVRFVEWCAEREIVSPDEVTRPVLERFQRHLFNYRKSDGRPLATNRQRIWIAHLQGLFRWLARHNHLASNPASDLDLPRKQTGQLRDPLSIEEVEPEPHQLFVVRLVPRRAPQLGDTGSLPLGGLLGLFALVSRQELLLIVIGGVFVAEAMSVMIQVFSFRYFGKRVFKIAPLHHHFEKVGWSETKIVTRFFIVSVLLAVFCVAALRIK